MSAKRKSGGSPANRGAASRRKSGLASPIWPILRRLLGYMRPHAVILTGVILAALATSIIELAPPWIIRLAVDVFVLEGRVSKIWWAAGGLLALSLVQGGIDFLWLYLTAFTGQRIIFDLRNEVFEQLSRLSFSFYDRARPEQIQRGYQTKESESGEDIDNPILIEDIFHDILNHSPIRRDRQ